jgi:hypothetical protein
MHLARSNVLPSQDRPKLRHVLLEELILHPDAVLIAKDGEILGHSGLVEERRIEYNPPDR